jgi:carbon storage regulator
MLVLSRKVGESLTIMDGQIVITLVSVQGDRVRLGVEADRSISVLRTELLKKSKPLKENASAPDRTPDESGGK